MASSNHWEIHIRNMRRNYLTPNGWYEGEGRGRDGGTEGRSLG